MNKKNPISKLHKSYSAKLRTPFAVLGVHVADDYLTGIDFLDLNHSEQSAATSFAKEVCAQLNAYLKDSKFRFDLPLDLIGTDYQKRIWQAMQKIPPGKFLSYGELAKKIDSGPRAVGNACGANPIPIIVPCHRVLAAHGKLGGFMKHTDGNPLIIKRWLLQHEGI
jgi:methylated-DNA-[protein]-cysteine S-methyltransferase